MCVLSTDSLGGTGQVWSSYTANSSKETLQLLPDCLEILIASAAPLSGRSSLLDSSPLSSPLAWEF